MKAAARRIMEQVAPTQDAAAIDEVEKVNALERPAEVAVYIVPETWTPEHVAVRIVEAFVTLAILPKVPGPKEPGSAWPEHVYDWEDRLSQATLTIGEQRDRERSRNRAKPRATGEDIRRMEIVLGWLSELYKVDQASCRAVQRWAHLRSIKKSVKGWCETNGGIQFQTFYRRRDKGIAQVVEKLGAASVW